MFYKRCGKYSYHISDEYEREYHTFIPTPLCDINSIKVDNELLVLCSDEQSHSYLDLFITPEYKTERIIPRDGLIVV